MHLHWFSTATGVERVDGRVLQVKSEPHGATREPANVRTVPPHDRVSNLIPSKGFAVRSREPRQGLPAVVENFHAQQPEVRRPVLCVRMGRFGNTSIDDEAVSGENQRLRREGPAGLVSHSG